MIQPFDYFLKILQILALSFLFIENKDLNFNMLENFKIEPRNDEIGVDTIVQELRRLKNEVFTSMDDETKMEYIISKASYEFIDWHCKNKLTRKKVFLL